MDTFELLEMLIQNSTFSRGALVNSLKNYPLERFTSKTILKNIFDEKGRFNMKDPDEFVSYLFEESKNRKLTKAQNNKKRKILEQKEVELKAKKAIKESLKLQSTIASINSQVVCNSCGVLVNLNGKCKC
jgi:cell shape-determining protein MreC